jgi:hypothetical protein
MIHSSSGFGSKKAMEQLLNNPDNNHDDLILSISFLVILGYFNAMQI